MSTAPTILIVDDEPAIGKMLERVLKVEGFNVHISHSGEAALDYFTEKQPDVIILDINLPGISGDEVCRQLRKDPTRQSVGILMVTGRPSENQPAESLDEGADDYVGKPFDLKEVVARVKALLRRPRFFISPDAVVEKKGIQIDVSSRQVRLGNQLIDDLTPKEFELLTLLVTHSPKVIDKNTMALKVWGGTIDSLHERTIDVHIRRIRKKLGAIATHLKTVQTIGYQWLDS